MNVVIRPNEDEVAHYAYDLLRDRTSRTGKGTGCSPLAHPLKLYAGLQKASSAALDFSDVHTFNLDGCLGLPGDLSYRYFMEENLFQHIN